MGLCMRLTIDLMVRVVRNGDRIYVLRFPLLDLDYGFTHSWGETTRYDIYDKI